jgi:hypothetical protein
MAKQHDCIHGDDVHDPVSGACLVINEAVGPCPCSATPLATVSALEAAFVQYVRPALEVQRLELRMARNAARQQWNELMPYVTTLLHGTDEEVQKLRDESRRIDRLLGVYPKEGEQQP